MGAVEEFERIAVKSAQQAVVLDKEGKKGQAIGAYKKAVESLIKITDFCADENLNKIYRQRANLYRKRINALRESGAFVATNSNSEQNVSNQPNSMDELILRDPPKVSWKEIVGLENAKKAVKEAIVYPSLRPDIFPLGWPKGILLFGPPGCGKTLLAAAVSNEINATFISVDAASIMSKWLGDSERNVAKLFKIARKREKESPSIIFVDELDSIMGTHRLEVGGETRVRNQFLKEMDGIIDKKNPIRVYVIGSTNKPWSLDNPFIRRFQKRIYVPPPNDNERLAMFKLYTEVLNTSNLNFKELVTLSEGCSGSDIMDICQSVQLKVNSELFESGEANTKVQPRTITMEDFLDILGKRKPSIAKESLVLFQKWHNSYKAL